MLVENLSACLLPNSTTFKINHTLSLRQGRLSSCDFKLSWSISLSLWCLDSFPYRFRECGTIIIWFCLFNSEKVLIWKISLLRNHINVLLDTFDRCYGEDEELI